MAFSVSDKPHSIRLGCIRLGCIRLGCIRHGWITHGSISQGCAAFFREVLLIKIKVFIAILSANLLLAISMFLVSNWSFQNGFLDYVNRTELNKLDRLANNLQGRFEREGSFASLQATPRLWRKLIRDHVWQPVVPRESSLLRSTFSERSLEELHKATQHRGHARIFLLNANKEVLIGPNRLEPEPMLKPLNIKGETIGYLAYSRSNHLSHKLDRVFAKQQQQSYLWIALGSLLISILIALPFANQLIKPILALLHGTQELSKGNYTSRVHIQSNDEVGKLSQSFNLMADRIETSQRNQKQWLSDISHELRTPLSVLKGEIEATADGIRKPTQTFFDSLSQEVNYINRLVEDLHELAQSDMKALSLHKEDFILAEALNNVLENFHTELSQKKLLVDIECDSSLKLSADKNRMTQVFINLFQNNIRYTQMGGKLFIRVQTDLDQLIISWVDNGPGVQTKNLNKLFERLYREDEARDHTNRGSGLGLSICKTIIENHHGSIEAFLSDLGGLGLKIILPHS